MSRQRCRPDLDLLSECTLEHLNSSEIDDELAGAGEVAAPAADDDGAGVAVCAPAFLGMEPAAGCSNL